MKKLTFILLISSIQFISCSPKKATELTRATAPTTTTTTTTSTTMKIDTISYSLGVLLAKNLQQQGFTDLKSDDLAKAISDVMDGNNLQISPTDANALVMEYQQAKQAELEAENAKKFAGNKEAGAAFLAKNKVRKEVITTASGLQYEVMTQGSGPKPTKNDKVSVHYHGTLLDGTVFDSSVERGEPTSFGVTQVIQGWVEGLQLMNVGSKYKFFIPYDLAYGERAAGPAIGPFSTLIFEVELLGIQ